MGVLAVRGEKNTLIWFEGWVFRAAHLVLGHVGRDLDVGHDGVTLDVPVAEIGLGADVGDDLG